MPTFSRTLLSLLVLAPVSALVGAAGALLPAAGASGSTLDPAGARRARLELMLRAEGRADLAGAWERAILAEREANAVSDDDPARAETGFREAIETFEAVAAETGSSTAWWRAARAYWLLGELYPVEDKERRLAAFTASVERASRGIEVDGRCGECMFWKFTAIGRVSTTRGLLSGLWDASEMARLLDDGISLAPTHRDHADNSTLGNLHYGSAVFYRVLPDWRWLGWLIGVRGDKERALGHAQKALAMHPGRLDYKIELGSQLLCLGASASQPERLAEGVALLEHLLESEAATVRDERHLLAARVMLESPVKACGYSGDSWIEIDAADAAAASSSR